MGKGQKDVKRIISFLLISLLLGGICFPAAEAKAVGLETTYSEQIETSPCCGTDSELTEEMSSALLAGKNAELQQEFGISTFSSQVPHFSTSPIMPSTGKVKMLVLPVAFPDYTKDKETRYDAKKLENLFLESIFREN